MENEMKSDVAGLRGECAADIAIVVAALKRCDMNLHGYGKCGTLTGGGDWTCPQCAAIAAIKRLERLFLTPCPCEGLQEDCERLQGLLAAEYGRTQDLQAERDSLRAELAALRAPDDLPEIPCCPPHEQMLRSGATKPLDNCFVCTRNHRDELLDTLGRIALACVERDIREVYHLAYMALVDMTLPAEKQADIMSAAIDKARSYTSPSPERPSTADEGLSISEEEL
jgi:hypothetical protein